MIYPLLRVAIGSVLLVSGFEKAVAPYQNFVYALQAYQLFSGWAETLTAVAVPWVEIIIGLFLVLGLWTSKALQWALMLFSIFILVVAQALFRGIPLGSCGCFGSWIQLLPQQVIVFDSFCFLGLMVLLRNTAKTRRFSLDERFIQP